MEKADTRRDNLAKSVEAICRNCGTKGHYKVCMKKSTHLVNVLGTSITSTGSADYQPDYFNEYGDPVYAHMVHAMETNQKKHLIQFPISVNLEKCQELDGSFQDQLSNCSPQGWHRRWCKPHEFDYIWQNNRQ